MVELINSFPDFTGVFGDKRIGPSVAVCRCDLAKPAVAQIPFCFATGYAVVVDRMGDKISRARVITVTTAAVRIIVVVAVATGLANADNDLDLGLRNLRREGKNCRKASCHQKFREHRPVLHIRRLPSLI